MPFITSIATNSKITMTDEGEVRPWAFRACLSDPQSGAILGQYAVNECGYKKIAIIYEIGSDFSIGVTDEFSKSVEGAGGEIVASEAYNTGDVDYRAVLTKIRNAGDFDALYIAAGYYKQIGLIANQARELGIEQPFLTTEGAMYMSCWLISRRCGGMIPARTWGLTATWRMTRFSCLPELLKKRESRIRPKSGRRWRIPRSFRA